MMRRVFAVSAVLIFATVCATPEARSQPAPLAPFERLIGGEWRSGNTVQVFEWGPGRSSVIARSYTAEAGRKVPSSVGIWYWHPGEKTIEGRATAVNMPVSLFEYKTRFEGDVMRSELVTHSADGETGVFVETWEFTGKDAYEWRLLLPRPDRTEVVMSATFGRRARQ
ncbi:MAG: hypothetical protein ACODAB_01775 [Gemmatimonadota bacterium]